MTREELFQLMKGTIIVSCQATPGEPLYDPERSVMPLMARAAKQAGAKMIRTPFPIPRTESRRRRTEEPIPSGAA